MLHRAKAVWTLSVSRRRVSVPGIFLKANLFGNGERKNYQHRGDNNGKFAVSVPVSADCAVRFMSQGSNHCNRRRKQTKTELTTPGRAPINTCVRWFTGLVAKWTETTSRLQAAFLHSQQFRRWKCRFGSHERHH